MDLRQLECFDAVARHGHFTRAAEQLRIAQPAVSAQIRRLERELGVELFQRTTRSVRLTQAGELLRARVSTVFAELARVRAELDQLSDLLRGRVVLGAVQSLGPLDLPGFLAQFHRRHPGVEIGLRSGTARELVNGVQAGELDLALTPLPREVPPGLHAGPLCTEELVVAVPPEHPLSARESVSGAQLRDENFVSLPADSDLRRLLATITGTTPQVPFEARDHRRIGELVANGLGIALMPRSLAGESWCPLAPRVHRTMWLVRRKGRQARAGRACRDQLIDWSARISPPPPHPASPDGHRGDGAR